MRCRFGPRRPPATENRQQIEPQPTHEGTAEGGNSNRKHTPKSRHKHRCTFGPTKNKPPEVFKENSERPSSEGILPETEEESLASAGRETHRASTSRDGLESDEPQTSTNPEDGLPAVHREHTDRVTFSHQDRPSRTPFDRYRPTAEEAPRLNPNRFNLQRLGITEAELEHRVELEVDELLSTFQAERRLARLSSPEGLTRILTRDDCWTLFRATGSPTSGSLLGVYWWASGFGSTRFNFEIDWTPEQITLLDAYD